MADLLEPAIRPSIATPDGQGDALRVEGPGKLTGAALYTDDLVVPGAWYGVTVRSTEARARLLAVERDPAFDWSSVVLVTAADIPGENVVSLMSDDQPALAAGEIRHVAEPVALVAAADPETARAARDHVMLRTEPLEPVLDPLASAQAFARYEIVRGDVDAAFAALPPDALVLEGTYRTGHQEQLYIEGQAVIASPRGDGGVTITGSLQCPWYVHAAIKRALALDDARAVVIQAETGGGFGGKEEYPSVLAVHAALLARAAGRPVRMIYDRHEDLVATTKRHPSIVTHRTAVTADGRLLAQDIEVVMDGGAYCTLSPVVLSRGSIHAAGPYACPNVRIRARMMATNTPPNGAFRGFGAPQVEFAVETHVNRIAERLGLPPDVLRRRWAYRVGDTTATGQLLRDSVGALDVLDGAVAASGFERTRERTVRSRPQGSAGLDGATRSGIGLALGWHGAGFTGSGETRLGSVAAIELTADGVVRVLASAVEMGQGSRTVFAQLVAESLGIPVEGVAVAPVDTSVVPDSGPTVASRSTMIVGGLLVSAARRLRDEVEAQAGRPFADACHAWAAVHGPVRIDERFAGFPGIEWDDAAHRGDAYPAYSWGAAVAEVDVDVDTGEVAVRSVVAVDEVGRVVNHVLATGQVEGGTLQAVGYATLEEIKVEAGRYRNDRLATYLIPTAVDAPRITALFVEQPFAGAPHGAKGLGELPADVGAPAVIAAIHDAVGAWVTELPATPERVLDAIAAAQDRNVRAGEPR
jgi:CO/xanthine dehydrogenase Mo-binding subunit